MTRGLGFALDRLAAELGWGAPTGAAPRVKRAVFARLLRTAIGEFPSDLRVVKVFGTNGKGSTAAMLAGALGAAGLRTGLFTSPHLERVTERIGVCGRELAPEELDARVRALRPLLLDFQARNPPEQAPTFFQTMLLAAVHAFADHRVEVAIVEAGIGGASDLTAELPGPLSIITSVGLDHAERLGGSLARIGLDKAAGAADGSVLVLGPGVPPAVRARIHAVERERLSRISDALEPAAAVSDPRGPRVSCVHIFGTPRLVRPALAGAFQLENLATAARSLEELAGLGVCRPDGVDAWVKGLEEAAWPGRFEYFPDRGVLVDAAHNEHALRALAHAVRLEFGDRPRLLVFGTSREKDLASMLPHLRAISPLAFLVDGFHHAIPRKELENRVTPALRVEGSFDSAEAALAAARARAGTSGELVVATGSVFLAGQVRSRLGGAG